MSKEIVVTMVGFEVVTGRYMAYVGVNGLDASFEITHDEYIQFKWSIERKGSHVIKVSGYGGMSVNEILASQGW